MQEQAAVQQGSQSMSGTESPRSCQSSTLEEVSPRLEVLNPPAEAPPPPAATAGPHIGEAAVNQPYKQASSKKAARRRDKAAASLTVQVLSCAARCCQLLF